MYRIIVLIFAGCIGFTGFTACAQMSGGDDPVARMMESLMSGGTSAGSTSDTAGRIMDEIMTGTTGTTELPASSIKEGQRLVIEEETPEVNQTVIEVIDTRTGRYPPRLKVNFAEFPLRSLAAKHGRSVEAKTHADIVAQRIQSRLRAPNIELVVQDRTAIISGTVATERERSLAESMLRFEPGIDAVENKLTITP